MPRIDIPSLPFRTGSGYPAAYDQGFEGRRQWALGDPSGLTQFGANLVELAPGAMSSQRHWHEEQDEFLVVIEGTPSLIDDDGETVLSPGDCCAFPKGEANGHHIVNRSGGPARFVVVGTRKLPEVAHYSDVDMRVVSDAGGHHFTRRDGSPFEGGA